MFFENNIFLLKASLGISSLPSLSGAAAPALNLAAVAAANTAKNQYARFSR